LEKPFYGKGSNFDPFKAFKSRRICTYSRISLSGTSKSQLKGPASNKIPLNRRDLYGDRIKEAKGSVPLRPKSRLTRSRLKRFDCTMKRKARHNYALSAPSPPSSVRHCDLAERGGMWRLNPTWGNSLQLLACFWPLHLVSNLVIARSNLRRGQYTFGGSRILLMASGLGGRGSHEPPL
jgi:hypothetical protein